MTLLRQLLATGVKMQDTNTQPLVYMCLNHVKKARRVPTYFYIKKQMFGNTLKQSLIYKLNKMQSMNLKNKSQRIKRSLTE